MGLRKVAEKSWKGWGNWNDLKSLFEALGWWPYLVWIGSTVLTVFGTSIDMAWPPSAVILSSLAMGLLFTTAFSGTAILIQLHRRNQNIAPHENSTDATQAQAELVKQLRLQQKQNDPVRQFDQKQRELAGLVNAMKERALRWDFRLPVKHDDSFSSQHQRLQDSEHPIWADREINQLRRDFLNRCGIAGQEHESAAEAREARAEVSEYGTQLMSRLLGEQSAKIERDITMTEAFHLVNQAKGYPEFEDEFYQALYDGNLSSWGRRLIPRTCGEEFGPYQLIEREYWLDGRFQWITTGPGGTERAGRDGETDFAGIMFNGSQIRRLVKALADRKAS